MTSATGRGVDERRGVHERGVHERGVALVRPVVDRLAEGELTHLDRRPVDVAAAREQHAAYVAALADAGWRPIEVVAAPDHPDSVFVEDTVVVVDGVAVLANPGAASRRGEVDGTEQVVRDLGLELRRIEGPGHLEGGDVLQVGRTVYVGRGSRTDADGIAQLRRHLAPLGRTVVAVPLGAVLHLKSAATALPDGTVVGLADLLDPRVFPAWRDVDEEPGAHVVPLGDDRLVMAASAPATAAVYRDLGFDVVEVDVSEFEKLEGCVTCLSVLIPHR